jgi:error-prone DNA polymerase
VSDPFVHLHVASGYSLRHGASAPRVLVERAAEHGMDTLALTDRDGAYGVVKFAKACMAAGVRPVFGVDLAVRPLTAPDLRPSGARRTPARGGAFLDRDPDAPTGQPQDAGLRRPRPVPGRPARPRRARVGGAVPAGLGHPPRG